MTKKNGVCIETKETAATASAESPVIKLGIPCTAFLMFSASSVAGGTGSGIEMEAMESAAPSSPTGRAGSEDNWRKRRLRGGMLWMHSRQEHQQHMAHTPGDPSRAPPGTGMSSAKVSWCVSVPLTSLTMLV